MFFFELGNNELVLALGLNCAKNLVYNNARLCNVFMQCATEEILTEPHH